MIDSFKKWGPDFTGSTRPIALLRIGLVLVIWARYALELSTHHYTESWYLLLSAYFFIFTTMMLIGLYTRISVFMVALVLVFLYFFVGHGSFRPQYVGHHTYLMMSATFLLALTPCGRSYSVDRYRAVQKALQTNQTIPAEHGPLWAQRLIVLQMAALYFWTAVDKTGSHFLSGDRLEIIMTWAHTGRPLEWLLLSPYFIVPASIAVVIVEYLLPFGILMKRTLPIAVPVGLLLHAAFFLMLPLMTFSINMMLLYLAVIPPDKIHSLLDRLQGYDKATSQP